MRAVRLPPTEVQRVLDGADSQSPPEQDNRILLVDDNARQLEALRWQLHGKFDVRTAQDPRTGLDLVRSEGPFSVVVADYAMPEQNGVEFLREVHRIAPDVVNVILTCRTELDVATDALSQGHIFRFLTKPCPGRVLEATVLACLDQHRLITTERLLTEQLNRANEELHVLNETLEQRVAEQTGTIHRVYQFVSAINGLDTLEGIANLTVDMTADILRSEHVVLYLPERRGEMLRAVASIGECDGALFPLEVPKDSPIEAAFAESQFHLLGDPHADPPATPDPHTSAPMPLGYVPLATPNGPVGVLCVTEPTRGACYEEGLKELHAVTEAAAIAIQNQIRREERNESRDATILALAKLAEHRDPETGTHLERVQIYCRLLCETLARTTRYASVIDDSFIASMVRSSPLHDIGKVGIPDRILLKRGPLTDSEFELMKRHAVIGGDTIRALIDQGRTQRFLQMAMEIAYAHHERFDGSGYPFGLEGEEIPLAARIVSVADVYDALTTKRVYKSAMPHEQTVQIIKAGSGGQFDPDVVAAFAARMEEFDRTRARLANDENESGPSATCRTESMSDAFLADEPVTESCT